MRDSTRKVVQAVAAHNLRHVHSHKNVPVNAYIEAVIILTSAAVRPWSGDHEEAPTYAEIRSIVAEEFAELSAVMLSEV